jgi:hypothetical protein
MIFEILRNFLFMGDGITSYGQDLIPSDAPWHKEHEYIWFRGGDLDNFRDIQQYPVLRVGLTPGAIFNVLHRCMLPVHVTLGICFWRTWVSIIGFSFYMWPWTLQHDLERPWSTSPYLKEHLLSTTLISAEKIWRYELGRMSIHNGDSMPPPPPLKFFREHKNEWNIFHGN